MGTPFAVSYANIYMSWWMRKYYYTTPNCPEVTKRFIDDLAALSTATKEDLHTFVDHLNSRHPKIKFTVEISKQSVPFLDVQIHLSQHKLETDLYSKPTASHRYLPPTSCHPRHIFRSIAYSGALRIRRICSKPEWCTKRLAEFSCYLRQSGYSAKTVNLQIERASIPSRTDILQYKQKQSSNRIPWISTYDPRQPDLRKISTDNHAILKSSVRMTQVMPNLPVIAQRRPATIGDIIKQNKIKHAESEQMTWGCKPCNTARCACCHVIQTTTQFKSTVTGKTFAIKHDVNCKSTNVIYALSCKTCGIQYIGKTSQPFHKRLNGHRSNINTNKSDRSPYVVPHFRIPGHTLKDNALTATILCLIPSGNIDTTKQLESLWIYRAGTIHPNGLNEYEPTAIPD